MSRRKPAAHAGLRRPRTGMQSPHTGMQSPRTGMQSPRTGMRSRARAAWSAVTGTGAAASATLALLVLICTFVAVAVPRASLGYRTAVLQRTFATLPAVQKTVLAEGDLSEFSQIPLSAARLEKARVQLAAGLQRDGLPLAEPAARWQWSGLATSSTPLSGATAPALRHLGQTEVELLYRSTLGSQSALVAGSLPARPKRGSSTGTFPVAVTAATAARLGVHVGS